MRFNSSRVCLRIFLVSFIFGGLVLSLHGQTTKKPGAGNSDRDLRPKTPTTAPTPAGSKPAAGILNKDKRLALVIGNSQYRSRPLRNPVNDANLLADSLKAIDFQVTVKEDLSLAEIKEAIREFSKQLSAGGVGLFYFAGHGIQIDGRNFLIPTDFNGGQTDVAAQAVDVDFVIKEITGKSGLNILILDACRNAPEGFTASTKKGLAEIKNAPADTYIAFSTAPGKTAMDGTGNNSPYTESLAGNLRLRPARLEDVFIRTRIQMDTLTQGEQTPWESSSIRTIFYFSEDLFGANQGSTFNPFNPEGLGKINNLAVIVPVLNEAGKVVNRLQQTASYFVDDRVGLDMMQVRGGKFSMGTDWEEIKTAYENAKKYKEKISQESIAAEIPQHQVSVPGFFMSKHEITQAQWQAVMHSLPEGIPAEFRGPNMPVVNVTWRQANEFCRAISGPVRKYRLPTEAEWEYAAKAGTSTPFAFGKTISSDLVNFNGRFPFLSAESDFRAKPVPVGSLGSVNPFGLADMHGNVWEWTADNWHDNYNEAPVDGSEWDADEPKNEDDEDPRLVRVIRGGSWFSIASDCRSTSRRRQPQTSRSDKIGFRVVMQ